jgi:hypothetical protein
LSLGTISLPRSGSARSPVATALFFLFLLFVALASGAIVGLGFTLLNVLIIGGLGGLFLLSIPARYTIWFLIFFVFIVVGQVTYFGGIGQILWVPYGIALLLYFKLPALAAERRRKQDLTPIPLVWPIAGFLVAVALSVVVSNPSPFPALAGGKNLVALWSVFFLVALGAVSTDSIMKTWRFFVLVAAFQVPLVAYQYLVIVPSRTVFGSSIGARWDAVVGGFGGDPMSGGASGSMALFLCIVLFYGLALYRRKILKFRWLLLLIAIVIGCLTFAEVKVVAILIPIGLVVACLAGLRDRPMLTLALLPTAALTVVGILLAYGIVHGGKARISSAPAEVVERAFRYSLDANHINFQTGEMGRMAAIVHWWKENAYVDPVRTFVGHGPGASRGSSILGAGEAARKYPFFIDRSAATQLLWEVGLLGFATFCLVLFWGAALALKASRQAGQSPERSATLEATAAALLMTLVMVPYGRDVLEVPAIGVLMMLLLGYAALASRSTGALAR